MSGDKTAGCTMSSAIELLKQITEDSGLCMMVTDIHTHEIYYVNKDMQLLLQDKVGNYQRKKCYEYLHNLEQPCPKCFLPNLIKQPNLEINSLRHYAQNDSYLQLKTKVLKWNGKEAIIDYGKNVTEQIRTQKELEENARKLENIVVMEKMAAKQAVESQQTLNAVISRAGLWYWTYDILHNRAVLQNKCAVDFGTPLIIENYPDSLINSHVVLEPYRQLFFREMEKIKNGEPNAEFDVQLSIKDGSTHWVRIDIMTVYDDNNKPVKAICLGQIVDKTKAMEEEFKREEARMRASDENLLARVAANLTKNIILEYKAKDSQSVKLYKQGIDDLRRFSLNVIVNDEEREKFRSFNNSKFLIDNFTRGKTEHMMEYRRRLPDGRVFWVRNVIHLLQQPDTGDIIMYEYCYNIHANKMMTELLNVMVKLDYETVGSLNLQVGYITLFSGSESDHFPSGEALAIDKVASIYARKFLNVKDAQKFKEIANVKYLREKMARLDRYEEIFHIKRKDGILGLVKFRLVNYDKENEICILTCTDVTDIQREEEQKKDVLIEALDVAERANQAKSVFLSSMSHDIRTPLNAIIGMSNMALEEPDNLGQAMESMKIIRESSDTLLGLINDVLDLSRIERGKTDISYVPVSLIDFHKQIEVLYRPLMQQKHQQLVSKINVKHENYLMDEVHLKRIAENIITNAIKYTQEGGTITIFVEEVPYEHEGMALLKFGVGDNGMGMSQEEVTHIFEPFFRSQKVLNEHIQGTGLGMPIVKSLVEMLNGSIKIDSVPGKGTKVTITVPLRMTAGRRISPESIGQYKEETKNALNGKVILLAEDNYINIIVATKLLEKVGIKTVAAKNGQEALDRFTKSRTGEFAGILMDVQMPIMDGLDTARKIRSSAHPEAKTIPIIAMTANAFAEDIRKSMEAGMNAHLSKPIKPEQLYRTLEHFLGKN